MAPSSTKISLKDKVEDGEIDLSMSDLQDVPVKEIAAVKKAHSLDLSNNHISLLPRNFTILVNLTKLDLSKNELTELPEDFGELCKLKHLDLYKNRLEHLPLSFTKLKALRWLDLKDNPLKPAILNVAGPCLETKQCQDCAKNIVAFYTKLDNKVQYDKSVLEEKRQKELQDNIEKAKQEKKKKPKKEKATGPKETYDKNIKTKTSDTNVASVQNKKSTPPKVKQSSKSSVFSYFKSITVAFFLLTILMFILTATKIKCLHFIEDKVAETWTMGVSTLPSQLQGAASAVGTNFKTLHEWTGQGVVYAAEHLGRYNSVNVVVTEFTQVCKNVSATASKIYLKVFGE